MADIHLPVELFQLIGELSPRPSQKTLLLVSKLFHGLALPLLFSRIVLNFGIKRRSGRHWDTGAPWTEEETTQLHTYDRRSFSILHHIEEDVRFATMVRALSVRWYDFPFVQSSASARGLLGTALGALSSLESFEWRGNSADIPQHAVTALQKCQNLRTLLIPPMQCLWPELLQLHELTKITLMVSRLEWIPSITNMSAFDRRCYESALQLIDLNAPSLEDITTSYWMFPSAPLPNLRSATFLRATGATGLEGLIHHSPLLTSLTITATTWNIDRILVEFASSPEAFPLLTSFKFLITHNMRDCDANPLVAFLQNKQQLRRLHLGMCSKQSQPVVRLLPKLPNLEVLGLGWGGMQFKAERAEVFEECLPRNLRALSINIDEGAATLEAFLALIKRRPALKACYLPLLDHIPVEFVHSVLVDDATSVELVGAGHALFYICRPSSTHHRSVGAPSLCSLTIDPSLTLADYGLDGWQWLAMYDADLGQVSFSVSSSSACGATGVVRSLVDCVDLRPLEGAGYVLDHRAFGLA